MTTVRQRDNLKFRIHRMLDRGMSQAKIVDALGVTHKTVREYRQSWVAPEEKTNVTPPPFRKGYAGWR